MILLISGSSCSGKNTTIKELIKNNKNIKYINTFTSREKRPNESDGNPYFFITKEEFQKKIKNNDFYEYELIHNNFYGVDKKLCQDLLNQNYTLLKDMGVMGTFNFKENLDGEHVETVYLDVNKSELKHRLIKRGDKSEDIKTRLSRYKFEKSYIKNYNFVIENNDLNKTVLMLDAIIKENKQFYEYILPIQKIENINLKKLDKLTDKLINNKVFKPIKVYFNGENFYLKKDLEKYLASILVNKNVTKELIFKNFKVNETEKIENVLNFINLNLHNN